MVFQPQNSLFNKMYWHYLLNFEYVYNIGIHITTQLITIIVYITLSWW